MAEQENLPEEVALDGNLRPKTWHEYVGQEKVKQTLKVIIESAKARGEVLEHILLHGNSGLGKTSLAKVIANHMGVDMKICTAPTLDKTGDVASLLSNLNENDILFIDECHRLHHSIAEMLYSAMEDYKLHLVIGRGPLARTMDLQLPRFTLIGATTHMSLMPAPLRNRFGAVFQLNFYSAEDIEEILRRSANLLGVSLSTDSLKTIAQRSRFTPRAANHLLKRVRDFALIEAKTKEITKEIAEKALAFLGVDTLGLDAGDRVILETIINKFKGGPVGLQALSAATGEEEETILDLREPYLLRLGFIERSPKGRSATHRAYSHLQMSKLTDLI